MFFFRRIGFGTVIVGHRSYYDIHVFIVSHRISTRQSNSLCIVILNENNFNDWWVRRGEIEVGVLKLEIRR